ncbi:TonB-dependent siderophore receptor [Methylobacillus methanolivorans]|uniref:TonB-dependent siderophore receptor n=1 Tax=Methylobacillus methanolivorans TaxID=1848927 RepID=A0ABW8GHS7_9PROT
MNHHHYRQRTLYVALFLVFSATTAIPALAADVSEASQVKVKQYDIPAGELATALQILASEAGVTITFTPEQTLGKQAHALRGHYSIDQAFDVLLVGSGLAIKKNYPNQYSLVQSGRAMPTQSDTLPEVRVTAQAESASSIPETYAGGQVAKGARLGMLGNQDIFDTPFNITAYTSDLIRNQQATSLVDVVANDPSVRVTTNGLTSAAGQGDGFMIRGLRSYSSDVLFDGVAGIAMINTMPVETLERVEILKGPAAMLSGMGQRGGVGGTINIVPKRAEDTPLNRLTLSYQSDRHYGTHVDIGRRFGEMKKWGVRFNGIYRDGETAVGGQSREFSVATLGVDFRDENLRASMDMGFQNTKTHAPTGAGGLYLASISSLKAPNAEKQISQDWEYTKNKGEYLLLKAEYDVSNDWTIYGGLGANWNKYQWLSSDIAVTSPTGDAQVNLYYYPGYSNRKSIQAGIRGTLKTGTLQHQLNAQFSTLRQESGYSFGDEYGYGYGFMSWSTNIYAPITVSKPSLEGFSSNVSKTDTLELPTFALSDTVSFLDDRVTTIIGVRHQQVKANGYDLVSSARTQHYDESAITPSLAVVFKPQDNLSLYASYIEGLSQGPTASGNVTNRNELFPPIKSKQLETGVKLDLGKLGLTASLFQITQPNGINVANSIGNPTFKVDGEQRNRGLELNIFGEVLPHVRLLGGAAWTDAMLTKTENGTNNGHDAPGVPRRQANLSVEWDPTLLPGLTLSGRMLATSRQYIDAENQASIPGWTRWDIGVRYTTQSWGHPVTLRGNIENLFGRDYWASTIDGSWLIQGLPRTLLLSATIDF